MRWPRPDQRAPDGQDGTSLRATWSRVQPDIRRQQSGRQFRYAREPPLSKAIFAWAGYPD